MMDETIPEILRTNLTNTILYLKVLGIHDVLSFDFLDMPDEAQMVEVRILVPSSGRCLYYSLVAGASATKYAWCY
jgi:hypothetical protein